MFRRDSQSRCPHAPAATACNRAAGDPLSTMAMGSKRISELTAGASGRLSAAGRKSRAAARGGRRHVKQRGRIKSAYVSGNGDNRIV